VRTLAFFFEGEFALFVVVLVLSSAPILSTLYVKNLNVSHSLRAPRYRECVVANKAADSGAGGVGRGILFPYS